MGSEIVSNSYKYIIDKSYGINKDGFIAIGSESIVYKGLKTRVGGGLQFSCVLKFKPKLVCIGGKIIDRLELFKTEEWKIFEELRECRSIVRIDDVVEELQDFSMPCDKVRDGVINAEGYFCVVEEFIDGWTLENFCREEYWKLRRVQTLENGVNRIIEYQSYSEEEKRAVQQSYTYDNILKYQNQILLFMINLCEILEFITEQKNILHLDIKPENVMVTKYGKELVLIDFGKSRKITKAERFTKSNLPEADYSREETWENGYQYGSLGYAAPECYSAASENSRFPFSIDYEQGRMSVESDLFSLGSTFWECLNMFELVTKNEQFCNSPYDFYRSVFLCDEAYLSRDLSCTSLFYHKKLDSIIRKCTRKRKRNYTELDNREYYHTYKELKKDLQNVMDSVPTIVREENVKARNAFAFCGGMLALSSIFLIIYLVYRFMAFQIAGNKWESIVADYNDTQFFKLEETAGDLVTTAPVGQADRTYARIAAFTYEDGDISEYEAEMLVELLQEMNDDRLLPGRVDEIMQHGNSRKYKEISMEIMKLGDVADSTGYELAKAIYNVEVGKTEIAASYEVLQKYQHEPEFYHALIKLKNVLDNDECIQIIAESTGQTRQEVQEFFKSMEEEE